MSEVNKDSEYERQEKATSRNVKLYLLGLDWPFPDAKESDIQKILFVIRESDRHEYTMSDANMIPSIFWVLDGRVVMYYDSTSIMHLEDNSMYSRLRFSLGHDATETILRHLISCEMGLKIEYVKSGVPDFHPNTMDMVGITKQRGIL
jgi:hypothetical protein